MDSRELLTDFQKALSRFQAALSSPDVTDVIKAGCIQYFELTFELAWKTIRRVAEEEGLSDCNSPKSALKAAFSSGWIKTEDVWLDMLSSRNKMSHTYSAEDALAVYDKLPAYVEPLKELAKYMEPLIS
jgi:nucleotidyltransferase substrate binding protein (TIGR01987 family)